MDRDEFAESVDVPTQYGRVAGVWEDVVAELEATAAEYREDGWEVLEVHAGHVATLDGTGRDRWGLDVLVPDDEFSDLRRLVEDRRFEACEVFRARDGDLVLLIVAMLAEADRVAVVFPAYYDVGAASGTLQRIREAGEMRTHLRPLSEESIVTFTQNDPSLFLPEEA